MITIRIKLVVVSFACCAGPTFWRSGRWSDQRFQPVPRRSDFIPDADPDPHDAGHGALQPSLDALIGGTLALMTAWTDAAPCGQVGPAGQAGQAGQAAPALPAAHRQSLVARKIVSNLFFMQHHPLLAAPLRQVVARARQRWLALAHPGQADAAMDCSSRALRLH